MTDQSNNTDSNSSETDAKPSGQNNPDSRRQIWSIAIGVGVVLLAGMAIFNLYLRQNLGGLTTQEQDLLFTAADLAKHRPGTKVDASKETFSKAKTGDGGLQLEYTYESDDPSLKVLKSVVWAVPTEEKAIELFEHSMKTHGQIALSFEADLYRRDDLLSEEHVDCSIVTLHGGHIWGNVCFVRRGNLVYHYGILGHGVEEKGGLDALIGPKISLLDQYDPGL